MLQKYLKRVKIPAMLVILFAMLQSALGSGLALVFQKAVDYAEGIKEHTVSWKVFCCFSLFMFGYIIILTLADFFRRYFRSGLIVKIDREVNLDYLQKVLNQEVIDYNRHDSAYYLSRFTNDLPSLVNDYIFEFFNLVLYFFQTLFTVIVAFCVNWEIAIILVALSFVIMLYTTGFEKKFSQIKVRTSEKNTSYVTDLKYLLQGYLEIKTNKAEKRFFQKTANSLGERNQQKRKWWNLEAIYSPIAAFLTNMLTFSSIVLACVLYIRGNLNTGLFVAAVYLSGHIFNPISNFFEQITYLKSNKQLVEQVYREFEECKKKPLEKIDTIQSIRFDHVSFSYEDKKIFENATFEIKKGKKYLIIGESGIGKSTLLKIIMGFCDYTGQILVDDVDFLDIDRNSWNEIVSYVPQDSYIFKDTIRNNIDLQGQHSDDDIMAVCEKTRLFRTIDKERLYEEVSEEINEVSGGEKQKIALARSILKNPQLLLLDEVTASLDKESAMDIEKSILSVENATVMYICHKVSDSLAKAFDYVVEICNNTVVISEVKFHRNSSVTKNKNDNN